MTAVRHSVFPTAFGFAAVAWRDEAIISLRLPMATASDAGRAILRHVAGVVEDAPPPPIATIITAIQRYFAGEAVDFASVPLDLAASSDFLTRVYAHVRGLGWGETTTYGAVARALGGGPAAAARAVGRAMATNPVPLIVPCHRVLAAGGALGGFSAPGGADTKARMLALEGAGATAAAQQAFAF